MFLKANKFDVVEFQNIPKLVREKICDNYGFESPLKAVCNVEYLWFYLDVSMQKDRQYLICFFVLWEIIVWWE